MMVASLWPLVVHFTSEYEVSVTPVGDATKVKYSLLPGSTISLGMHTFVSKERAEKKALHIFGDVSLKYNAKRYSFVANEPDLRALIPPADRNILEDSPNIFDVENASSWRVHETQAAQRRRGEKVTMKFMVVYGAATNTD